MRARWQWLVAIFAILGGYFVIREEDRDVSVSDPCFGGEDFEADDAPSSEIACGISALKGRRFTQEDKVFCKSNVSIPHCPGEATLLGVFDGHGGSAASHIAAKCFVRFFSYHLRKLASSNVSWELTARDSLIRALDDVEQAFIRNAIGSDLDTGTTACVAVAVDDLVLVANIGDSKALLCSSGDQVTELTSDHHPDRFDERIRIEASGGFVKDSGGIARVNGILAVSRSIGDLSFKKYGVTSEPEITDWRRTEGDYLVIASDGVFERLSPRDVCTLVEAIRTGKEISEVFKQRFSMVKVPIPLPSKEATEGVHEHQERVYEESPPDTTSGRCDWLEGSCICLQNDLKPTLLKQMAHSITETALRLGSTDNVAVVIYAFKEDVAHSGTSGVVGKMMNMLRESPFCYALVEPLGREAISSLWRTTGEGGLGNVSKSVERLCSSVAHRSLLPSANVSAPSTTGLHIQHEFSNRPDKLYKYLSLIASVPFDEESLQSTHFVNSPTYIQSPSPFVTPHYRYILKRKFARGSFGEIWLALRRKCQNDSEDKISPRRLQDSSVPSDDDGEAFVLKQILLSGDPDISLSGFRERHFGELFLNASQKQLIVDEGLNHIARFVDSFTIEGQDLWLVFRKEGRSLSKLLYESDSGSRVNASWEENRDGTFQMVEPSDWWRWLKLTNEGQQEMHSLLRQLLLGVKACHDRNITHRDIKPENMVVQTENTLSSWSMNLTLRIIDFGSAVDPFTLENLYGPSGPSRNEQTTEYAPPEALLLTHWLHFHPEQLKSYDMWSIGVVMLEMILGTPHVFQISSRTRILLDRSLEGWDQEARNVAYMLRALMEMCILFPRVSPRRHHGHEHDESQLASKDCSEGALLHKIMQRDPTGLGIQDVWALRLLRQLLQWYPEDRISVEEALAHPYFHPS